jgi:hypothetical protein
MTGRRKLVVFILTVVITGCTYDFPVIDAPTSGTADFSKVISIGNSITAGFANGALYDEGQANSYSNILAGQIALVSPGTYNQPDITSPVGYSGSLADGTPTGRLILVNPENPFPAPIIPGDAFDDNYEGDKTVLNNFGVPGIRLIDADEKGYANKNRYYKRFALDVNNSSVISDALAANSTFFTFWLGNNDVLGYATGGASGNPAGDGSNTDDLISLDLFKAKYEPIISQLLSNGAQGVIANIANVTDIPFFTTVPYDILFFDASNPEDTLKVYNLNLAYKTYNAGLVEAVKKNYITLEEANFRKITFTTGNNGVILVDEDLTDLTAQGVASIRMANSEDLLTFLAFTVINQDMGNGLIGSEFPLGDEYTLTPEEQSLILERTTGFNEIISRTVEAHDQNLALVDINSIFKEFAVSGANIKGSGLTASIFPPFGGFSLDGIHPNPRGAAYITNHFIEAINTKFKAAIPPVNPNNYPGNELPVPQ